jgi:hypothetical protein
LLTKASGLLLCRKEDAVTMRIDDDKDLFIWLRSLVRLKARIPLRALAVVVVVLAGCSTMDMGEGSHSPATSEDALVYYEEIRAALARDDGSRRRPARATRGPNSRHSAQLPRSWGQFRTPTCARSAARSARSAGLW